MTNDDKQFLQQFLQASGFIGVIVGLFILLIAFSFSTNKELTPGERLEVVDQYKNCEVVRYTDPSNRYHYLLHCPQAP